MRIVQLAMPAITVYEKQQHALPENSRPQLQSTWLGILAWYSTC
jgi:hypothetical protein